MTKRIIRNGRCWLIIAAVACTVPAGCSERTHEPKVVSLKCVVERIDRQNKEVTVRFYSEKRDAELTEVVRVTDETEILINGALARLADVKEGERAEGSIRVTKSADATVYTALRVQIIRADPLKAASGGAGVSGAAE